jgi:WD40 repeat protein
MLVAGCRVRGAGSGTLDDTAAPAPVVGDQVFQFRFPPQEEMVYRLLVNPVNTDLALTTNQRGHAVLWNLRTRERLWDTLIKLHKQPKAAAFSHDGRFVAVGGRNSNLRILDVGTGAVTRDLKLPPAENQENYFTLAFSPDDRFLVTISSNEQVPMIDVMAYHQDWREQGLQEQGHRLILWNAENGAVVRSVHYPSTMVRDVAFAADGAFFYTVDLSKIRIYKADTTLLRTVDVATIDPATPAPAIFASAISPDLRYAAISTIPGVVVVNLENGEPVLRIPMGVDEMPYLLRFTSDRRRIVGIDRMGSARAWSLTTGALEMLAVNHVGGTVQPLSYMVHPRVDVAPDLSALLQPYATASIEGGFDLWKLPPL